MSLEAELNVVWMASIFSIIDLTLTYYILWYDRKINPKTPKMRELNPVAKFIMKKTNLNPLGFIISAVFTQSVIWGVSMFMGRIDAMEVIVFGNFISGAIMVAIWIHFSSISMLHKMNKDRQIIKEAIEK